MFINSTLDNLVTKGKLKTTHKLTAFATLQTISDAAYKRIATLKPNIVKKSNRHYILEFRVCNRVLFQSESLLRRATYDIQFI